MFKNFKRLSVVVLVSTISFNIAYADDYMPPDKFKDPVKQFAFVKQSERDAETGWAEYKLGLYYETGYGVKKDISKAYAWYQCSSVNDFTLGVNAFKKLTDSMSKEQIAAGKKAYNKIVSNMLSQNSKDVNNTEF